MTTMMMDAEKDGKPLPMVNGKVAPMQFPLVFANCSMMSRPSRDRSLAGTKPAGRVGCFSPEKDLDVVF